MSVTIGTAVGLLGILIILCAPLRYGYTLTLFFTAFTRMAFVNVGENSILVYHILAFFFVIKLVAATGKIYIKTPKLLVCFLLYAAISISFALLYTDVYVINVDGDYGMLRPSVQQFTQYLYLFFGVVFMAFTSHMLYLKKVSVQKLLHILDIAYLTVAVLGISQLFVDLDVFDSIFRNCMLKGGNQHILFAGKICYRIDGGFGEPSMLSLFLVPIMCMHLYRILTGRATTRDIAFVGIGLLICLENQSSSAVVGMLIMAVCLVLSFFAKMCSGRKIKITKKRFFLYAVLLIAMIGIMLLIRNQLLETVDAFVEKLQGQGVSGIDRAKAATLQWSVFKEHFLFGVGFGTIRSKDLITGWLAQLGIVGVGFYLLYVISICRRLWRCRSPLATELMLAILVYNGIMMISVPEFMCVHIWVYYAMAESVVMHRVVGGNRQSRTPKRLVYRRYASSHAQQ